MILETDFTIIGLIIIVLLLPLYIYRKRLFKRFYTSGNSVEFVKEIYLYLKNNHPKIKFDFNQIKKFVSEKDIQRQQILMAEELGKQFIQFEYEFTTQPSIKEEHLWSSYHQNSKLQKDNKYPNDWSQRKELAWIRDKKQCNRCGFAMPLANANALLVKQMKHGGGFNLENIVILCSDCSRIVRSSNPEKLSKDLHVVENLLKKVH